MAIAKVTLNGVTQMDVTGKTVTAASMLNGVTALKNDGTDIIGSIASKSSSDLTVSGATVTAPAGNYASSASASVASGTAGTPTATKGTVSNHAISVTPSVTNTTGYIEGGTHTGTGVTVSASELVSGSQTITENDTYDVTNLASVIVNVSGGSSYTLLTTKEVEVSTTSTSSIDIPNSDITAQRSNHSQKMLYIQVRDKAGKRNGYFYGTDMIWLQPIGGSLQNNYRLSLVYATDSSGVVTVTSQSQYGVFPGAPTFSSDSVSFNVRARYHSTYSLTIDGTYIVNVYDLTWPDNISPFV